jgi:hypothetical protein
MLNLAFGLEEVILISHVFILLRWVWINVSGRSILSSFLSGGTISRKVSILVTSEALDL